MRVLMTTDTVGGVWTYSLDLCAGLAEHGVEVVLAAMGPELREHQRERASDLPNVRLAFRPFALEWMPDPWRDVDASESWLTDLAREHGAGLVHANTYAHGCLPVDLPTLVVGHSCVCSWYKAVRRSPPPPGFDEYRRRVARGLDSADIVVAPSQTMMLELQEHYGPLRRCRVVPNGRRLESFAPRRKEPFVLSTGRLWDDAKNIESLDRAASTLPWPICVAGDTRAPTGDERAIDALTCLGSLQGAELADFLARASIYAAPARYEPFGLAILEAAASGCALVLGDIPSLRELWGPAATFVPPEDVEALECALRNLMADPDRCIESGKRARKRARALTHERMARAYLELYGELVDDEGARWHRGSHDAHSTEVGS